MEQRGKTIENIVEREQNWSTKGVLVELEQSGGKTSDILVELELEILKSIIFRNLPFLIIFYYQLQVISIVHLIILFPSLLQNKIPFFITTQNVQLSVLPKHMSWDFLTSLSRSVSVIHVPSHAPIY